MGNFRVARYALSFICIWLAVGCAGGGSPAIPSINPATDSTISAPLSGPLFQPVAPANTVDPVGNYSFDSPAQATTGSNPALPPAVGQPLTGTVFPFEQSAIVSSSKGLSADTETNNAGATLAVIDGVANQFRLTIPSLGVNATFTSPTLLLNATEISGGNLHLAVSNLNYTIFGAWEVDEVDEGNYEKHLAAFVSGYETPVSAIPQSGTAIYSGTGNVAGVLIEYSNPFTSEADGARKLAIQGDATFTANFGTGAVTGNFKNMVAGVTPWNDISVSASIVAGTSHFSGTTTAAPVAQPFPTDVLGQHVQLSGASTGRIDGSFYGPSANELGAVWSVKDGSIATQNGTLTAIGVVSGR